MKKNGKSKSGLLIILIVAFVVTGVSCIFINNNTSSSYAVKNDEAVGSVDDGAATLSEDSNSLEVSESNDSVTFIPDTNKVLKKTNYTIEQIYELIRNTNQLSSDVVNEEMKDILINFYNYYSSDNKFINVYQEEYNYDEYMFVTKYNKEVNKSDFYLYLVNNNKCEVFKNMANHSRDDLINTYCGGE